MGAMACAGIRRCNVFPEASTALLVGTSGVHVRAPDKVQAVSDLVDRQA